MLLNAREDGARGSLTAGKSGARGAGPRGNYTVLIHVFAPRPFSQIQAGQGTFRRGEEEVCLKRSGVPSMSRCPERCQCFYN